MEAEARAAEADGPAVVSLTNVYKVYRRGDPVPALDGLSLSLPRGSYTAVMGPSGSGKSTLLNLVGCLDTPTAGRLEIRGREVSSLSEDELTAIRREEIGFIFQTFNLMPRLTALENVTLPMIFRGVSAEPRRERARELLESVGLADRTDHRPNELSGGQRQRVSIARALANDPALLLADEPTGNLDSETGATIMGVVQELADAGNTILLVTHERNIAEHAERIVHLLDGQIDAIEDVEERRRAEESAEWTS